MAEKIEKIVLLGFKGDCCGRNYNRILIELALKRKIELICVDYGKPKNILGSPSLREMERLIKEKKVQYLDLGNPNDVKKYDNLSNIDVVFVVTYDINHCKCARDFLGKARRIFIEKPLDATLRNVRLIENFPRVEKIIFGYDHYLSKFYPFQIQINKWSDQGIVGKVQEIEFRLLESSIVPPYRIKSLDRGMIYDLFSHGVAVATTPSRWVYPDPKILKNLRILKVEAAQYAECEIKGCTFAKIDFEIPIGEKYVLCRAKVGKGIGKKPEKTLRITGSKGKILVDIEKYNFTILNLKGKIIKRGNLDLNYAEAFLSAATDFGKPLSQIPGAMTLEVAKEMIFILDDAEWRKEPKGKFPRYAVGSNVSEIEAIIKKKIGGK